MAAKAKKENGGEYSMTKGAFDSAFVHLTGSDRTIKKTALKNLVRAVNLPALFVPAKLPSIVLKAVPQTGVLPDPPGIDSQRASQIRDSWSRYLALIYAGSGPHAKASDIRTKSPSVDPLQ